MVPNCCQPLLVTARIAMNGDQVCRREADNSEQSQHHTDPEPGIQALGFLPIEQPLAHEDRQSGQHQQGRAHKTAVVLPLEMPSVGGRMVVVSVVAQPFGCFSNYVIGSEPDERQRNESGPDKFNRKRRHALIPLESFNAG